MVIAHGSRGGKSEIRVPAWSGSVSGRYPPPGSQRVFSPAPHLAEGTSKFFGASFTRVLIPFIRVHDLITF